MGVTADSAVTPTVIVVIVTVIVVALEFTEAESDIPVHVRVHVHEGKISGRGLRYQGVVRVWSQDGGS